jgi:predicted sugar kinase
VGPAVYGIVKQEQAKAILHKTKEKTASNVGGEAFVAKANNKGAPQSY